MNAITIKDLCKNYGDFTLGPLDLCLPGGSILGLVGENGAGKSSTIKLIMNTLSRNGGSIEVLGTDNQSPAFRAVKEEIGIVLDEACFPLVMDARALEKMMARSYKNWDSALFKSYLQRFQLPEQKAFKDFSRGMKMKLAIAVALSHHPKLLILDEATSGLDPLVREEVLDIFNEFTRDAAHSVLISSHIISDLEKICDYIAFLHKGKLLICAEKDRLYEDYGILKLPKETLADIPAEAILAKKESPYGAEILIRNQMVSPAFPREYASLEDILLMLVKGA